MAEKINVPAIQIDVSQVALHIKQPMGLISQVADLIGAKIESIGDEKKPAFAVTISEPVVSHDYCRSVAAKIAACKKPVIEAIKVILVVKQGVYPAEFLPDHFRNIRGFQIEDPCHCNSRQCKPERQ